MNKIPVIRKGSINDYLSNGIGGGFLIGILVFLWALLSFRPLNSLYIGLIAWISIIVIWIGYGFTSEEYYKRKKKIKELTSEKYAFLDINNFILDQDLFFEGMYNGFFFRVFPMKRWIETERGRGKKLEFIVIESFYTFDSNSDDNERELKMCGDYFIGKIHFENHCADFIPNDWENPNFKENFDGLLNIFKREKLNPLMKDDWEDIFGQKLRMKKEIEEKALTRQIKFLNFKIEYKKQENKTSR